MDYSRNEDKWSTTAGCLSYNPVLDIDNNAAVAEPVTLQGAKLWAKIDLDTDDDIITALITAARKMCEDYCNINFVARVVTATVDNSNGGVYLPCGPIGTITGVTDIDGNTIDSDAYRITGSQFKQIIYPRYAWLQVVYTGGYSVLPEILKTAIKAQVLYLNENRGEGATGMSPVAIQILNPYRRVF